MRLAMLALLALSLACPTRAEDAARLVQQLADEDAAKRDSALETLLDQCEEAEPALRAALPGSDPEVKARIETILRRLAALRAARIELTPAGSTEVLGGEAVQVAISRDGKLMASCGVLGVVIVRECGSGKECCRVIDPHAPRGLAFSPDGKMLATSGGIWDSGSGKKLGAVGGEDGCGPPVWSPDGSLLAASGGLTTLIVFDMAGMKPAREVEPSMGVFGYAWRPGGKELLIADLLGARKIVDIASGEIRTLENELPDDNARLVGMPAEDSSVVFQADAVWLNGKKIPGEDSPAAIACGEGCFAVLHREGVVHVLDRHGAVVRTVASGVTNPRAIALGAADGPVVVGGSCVALLTREGRREFDTQPADIRSVAFSTDGRWVGVSGDELVFLGPKGVVRRFQAPPGVIGPGPKATEFLVLGPSGLAQWDPEAEAAGPRLLFHEPATAGTPSGTCTMELSPDGSRIAYTGFDWCSTFLLVPDEETQSGSVGSEFDGFRDVAWRPDGNLVAFGQVRGDSASMTESGFLNLASRDGAVEVRNSGCSGAWTPDGKTFASVDRECLKFFDPEGEAEIGSCEAAGARWVRFLDDDTAITHNGSVLTTWLVATRKKVREIDLGWIRLVVVSKDGKRLAVADGKGSLKLFDIRR